MIDESSLEAILRPLIEVDTSNPPGKNYKQIADILKEQLAPTGCEIEFVKTPTERYKELARKVRGTSGERVNLVATLDRGEGKTMIFNAHVDVVPASSGWTKPPFNLTRMKDEWYGRGVSDDKGPLAMFVLILRELAKTSGWRGKIILAATVDEEIGGYTGLGYLLDEGKIRGDYCIVGDGDIDSISNAANGCLRFIVTITGKSVHSSMNWMGINAVEKAAKLITRLEAYNKILNTRKSNVPTNPDKGVKYLTPSLTVGLIRGGIKVNIVPDNCMLEVDRRVIPEENKIEAIEEFEKILEEIKKEDKDFNYTLDIDGLHDSFYVREDDELITMACKVYEEVTKKNGRVLGTLGCLDTSYVAKRNIPALTFGVARVDSNIHGVDERVKIKDLIDFGRIVKETTQRLLK